MSFVKIPRKYSTRSAYGHNTKRRRKPVWDDTINDLSVHKATPEEMQRRKEVTTSKNMDIVKSERVKKKISRSAHGNGRTPGRKDKSALLREVLYDTSQLHDVLAKSDKMMSVVRDLFGDDPMKYKGLPHVTSAPDTFGYDSTLPEGSIIEEPSKLDILSESIMDRSALNELDDETGSIEYETDGSDSGNYQPKLDFNRFQQLLARADAELEREKKESIHGHKRAKVLTHSMADKVLNDLATKLGVNSRQEDGRTTPITAVENTSPVSMGNNAINDTLKVQKTKSRLTDEERLSSSGMQEDHSNLDNLRRVLVGLEANIADFEKMTGREPSVRPDDEDGSTLTGFTGRLVSAVNKVSKYLKENELRLRAETTLREHLHQDVMYLKTLVDTLTSDIIATQEQYVTLQSEFMKYKKETMDEISSIKQGLESRGIQIHPFVKPTPHIPAEVVSSQQHISSQPHDMQTLDQDVPQQNLNLHYPRPVLTNTGHIPQDSSVANHSQLVRSSESQQQYNNNTDSVLAQQLADKMQMALDGNSTGLAYPIGIPRQSDSPKSLGKTSSRIQPEERAPIQMRNPYLSAAPSNNPLSYSQPIGVLHQPNIRTSLFGQQQSNNNEAKRTVISNPPINNQPLPNHIRSQGQSAVPLNSNLQFTTAYQGRASNPNQLHHGAFQPTTKSIVDNRENVVFSRNTVQINGIPQTHLQQQLYPNVMNSITRPQVDHGFRSHGNNINPGINESMNMPNPASKKNHIVTEIRQPRPTTQEGQSVLPSHMSSNLEKQIEELNRQHSEAQNKLQQLLNQQDDVENKLAMSRVPVSPPISPITVDSDNENQQKNPRSHQPKEIKIALPRVENIIELQNQGH